MFKSWILPNPFKTLATNGNIPLQPKIWESFMFLYMTYHNIYNIIYDPFWHLALFLLTVHPDLIISIEFVSFPKLLHGQLDINPPDPVFITTVSCNLQFLILLVLGNLLRRMKSAFETKILASNLTNALFNFRRFWVQDIINLGNPLQVPLIEIEADTIVSIGHDLYDFMSFYFFKTLMGFP